jgi:hypothetical protein
MKKLIDISSQIKNNTFSYTGKGVFEAAIKNHKDTIINWLVELVPLQKQIDMLYDLTLVYEESKEKNYLKYPGKNNKFLDYGIFNNLL